MAAFIGRTCMRNIKHLSRSGLKLQTASIGEHIYLVPQRCFHKNRRVLHLLQKNPSLLWKSGRMPHICGILAVRHNSSVPQPPDSFPPGYIPDKPPVPLPDPDFASQIELNALGEPTLQSLGLGSYYPSGLVQQALEFLHVSLDCQWWTAIAISTVVLRLCLFPLMVVSRKNSANMQNHMPTMQRLQEKIKRAKMSGNNMEVLKSYQELLDYTKRNDVKVSRMFLLPLVQVPIFVSVFWGMRAMANLPVESMKTGGMLWFTDLTIPDPYFLLPVMTAATLFLTIELGVETVSAKSLSHVQKWLFRIMPFVMIPVMLKFPAAMLCYWFSSNSFSLVQALILNVPAVRSGLGIPTMVQHEKKVHGKNKPFIQGFKESWQEQKVLARMKDRERVEREKFERSGKGPLVKTYPYNPVEQKLKQKMKG